MNPLLLLAFVGLALADVDVQVGLNGQLRFSPETVFGNPGELVNFHFHGSIHSATESTARLNDPCHPLGGFDTGIQKDGSVQSIVISTHNSIYVHCTPHCGQGMVMIVNPGPNDSVETFRKAAIAQEGGGGGGGSTPTTSSSSTSAPSPSRTSPSSSSLRTSSTTVSLPVPSLSTSAVPSSASGSNSVSVSGASGSSSVSGSASVTAPPAASSSGAALTFTPNAITFFFSSLLAMML